MAQCKDCIHEKVCDALIKSGCPYLDEEVPADAFCVEFRNTADVVPKSEYDVVVEENESLGIELENMRRNLGDAREGWNDAECEVEELKAIIADHQANEERWQELYADTVDKWEKAYEKLEIQLENVRAEIAREIFEEIYRSVALKIPMEIRPIFKDDRDFDAGFINGKRDALLDVLVLASELKKKYTEGEG